MFYRYIGGGFIPGIPARDLSEEEYEGFSGDDQIAIESSSLWVKVDDEEKAEKGAPANKALRGVVTNKGG
jgi:hypothetical protein